MLINSFKISKFCLLRSQLDLWFESCSFSTQNFIFCFLASSIFQQLCRIPEFRSKFLSLQIINNSKMEKLQFAFASLFYSFQKVIKLLNLFSVLFNKKTKKIIHIINNMHMNFLFSSLEKWIFLFLQFVLFSRLVTNNRLDMLTHSTLLVNYSLKLILNFIRHFKFNLSGRIPWFFFWILTFSRIKIDPNL
jgi:hypothetical protein